MIDSVRDAGFNAIRIPVTWGEHMNGDTIDSDWLDRVQEVVDYAYNDGLYVILNMHHDDYTWFKPQESEYAANSDKLKKIWGQVAGRFADYGDTLLFEGMNEPRTVGSSNEWMGGTAAERAVVNKYAQDFVDTVRATGGNNLDRTLIVTSYGASAETVAINDLEVPYDANIIVSVHYYAPWLFSEGVDTTFGDSQKSELDNKFAELKQKFVDKGVPLIIGEFGCVNAADASTRAEYYAYYISSAKQNGISCFIWDNNIASGESSYGLFSRSKLTWDQTVIDAVMAALS
jgi:aryl-phospho-beta-D-glucosidase BglC (GH1 family)